MAVPRAVAQTVRFRAARTRVLVHTVRVRAARTRAVAQTARSGRTNARGRADCAFGPHERARSRRLRVRAARVSVSHGTHQRRNTQVFSAEVLSWLQSRTPIFRRHGSCIWAVARAGHERAKTCGYSTTRGTVSGTFYWIWPH